jgi:hypothetical protein
MQGKISSFYPNVWSFWCIYSICEKQQVIKTKIIWKMGNLRHHTNIFLFRLLIMHIPDRGDEKERKKIIIIRQTSCYSKQRIKFNCWSWQWLWTLQSSMLPLAVVIKWGSLSLTEQELIWKNTFSFVAQQSLSLTKSKINRMKE